MSVLPGLSIQISIHAPSRERLMFVPWYVGQVTISIHAPSRERLEQQHYERCNRQQFQSTLPRGSDCLLRNFFVDYMISIHAPSRERQSCSQVGKSDIIFQSTLPRGSDCQHDARHKTGQRFQSTLPRGSDALCYQRLKHGQHFNPRSLAGATCGMTKDVEVFVISIHAPSRERLSRC